ncbi:uncharacterized protein LOC101743533 isoform X2 [Bombyx mori]|uniref:uncharacterized protein LOC101743533 isoform X2 n=1 Tax=Bombyx mori TaxID=7091 RepID=UPI000B3C6584
MGVSCPERQGCSAERIWYAACTTLGIPEADDPWKKIVEASPPDSIWHSLRNCVAYQAGVWQNLITKGIDDVMQPAAFKLAIVLRHTPTEDCAKLMSELLKTHPVSVQEELTSYCVSLLTDDEARRCACWQSGPSGPPAPLRDLLLYGDLELAILAASREEYDAHAKLVRAEYSKLTQDNYVELRIKVTASSPVSCDVDKPFKVKLLLHRLKHFRLCVACRVTVGRGVGIK